MSALSGPIEPRPGSAAAPIEADAIEVMPAPPHSADVLDAVVVDESSVQYVGLITRAVALSLDAAVINVVAIFVTAGTGLIVSLLHLPHEIKNVVVALGAAAYALWTVGYFVSFWSAAGQTPGSRIMRFRVVAVRGERLKPRRALLRFVGLVLAALPLFAGYVMILFNRRRRGLQDYLARTVVIEAPQIPFAEARRTGRRAAAPDVPRAGAGPAAPDPPRAGAGPARPPRDAVPR